MNIPKKLRIGPTDYMVNPLQKEVVREARIEGLCIPNKCEMFYDPELSDRRIYSTILHEIVHALLYEQGHQMNSDEEEMVARHLEPGLVGLIRDNPTFIRNCIKVFREKDSE